MGPCCDCQHGSDPEDTTSSWTLGSSVKKCGGMGRNLGPVRASVPQVPPPRLCIMNSRGDLASWYLLLSLGRMSRPLGSPERAEDHLLYIPGCFLQCTEQRHAEEQAPPSTAPFSREQIFF